MKIVFMGTPEFAAGVLQYIISLHHNVVAVVTMPDKPSGRGQKITSSAVKNIAMEYNIPLLQPTNLKDEQFLKELSELQADLFLVIAFRMLPKVVWNMPPKGTINLHASLLPQYRGAAPINHVLINGEEITGVTTFFINENIDTGDIIDFISIPIENEDNAGTLHDKLMNVGSELVHRTLNKIYSNDVKPIPQNNIDITKIQTAPKIFKDFCRINFYQEGKQIQNFVRGLSPYPAAFIELKNNLEEIIYLKIFKINFELTTDNILPETVFTDNSKILKIRCKDSWVFVKELQLLGKKRMQIDEFIRGFRNLNNFNKL